MNFASQTAMARSNGVDFPSTNAPPGCKIRRKRRDPRRRPERRSQVPFRERGRSEEESRGAPSPRNRSPRASKRLRTLVFALQKVGESRKGWNCATKFENFLQFLGETASTAKKELREAKEGLLAALALPNFAQAIGSEEKPMLKATKHFEYLCSNGLMRIDRENALVHLVGYPVLLQQEIRNRLSSLFADAQLVSPSSFVRPAVLQGVNVDLSDFPAFSYGSPGSADMYLVGHSLPALLAPFIRTDFTEKNSWPILLQSSGMAYRPKRANPNLTCARQRLKHCLLSLASSSEQIDTFLATAISKIAGFLNEELELDVKGRLVMGKELRNYESQAVVFEEKGLELARISRADDYISRRLNIRYDEDEFVQMMYLETDIDRVIARVFDNLIDGCERPRLLRKLMKK